MEIKITDERRFIQEAREQCKIVDAVMVRGLSTKRNDNLPPKAYHRYAEDTEFGLITYTPLYLTKDNPKFQNPTENKTIY